MCSLVVNVFTLFTALAGMKRKTPTTYIILITLIIWLAPNNGAFTTLSSACQ
jgi:hypothetical protein